MKPRGNPGVLVPVCPYCHVAGVLVPTQYGRRWECPMDGCDARVGVHRNSPRAATLGMIREFGVTLPLRAFRALPKPLQRIEALVLEKLEGVAQHLGAP